MPSDEVESAAGTGAGPPRRSSHRRLGRLLWRVAVLAAIVLVLWSFSRFPTGTSTGSLALRAGVGAGVGLIVVGFVVRFMRGFSAAPPSPPARVDARASDVVYECPVCGTRVRLEVVATGKAPRHCGEEMEARLG